MMTINHQHTGTSGSLRNSRGFTLIEIIVTLILIAITGVVMFPVLRTNLTKSALPLTRVDSQYQLVQEMDRLTAQYRDEILNDSLNINTFKSTYVDTSTYIDAGNTGFVGVGQITGSGGYNNQSTNILRVTLVDGEQRLVSFFTE
jgi:prepilin-type N-terminal cleavage/methylation domain-containing protein